MYNQEEFCRFLEEIKRLQEEGKNVDQALQVAINNIPEEDEGAIRAAESLLGRHEVFVGAEWHQPASQGNPTDLIFRTDQAK